MRSWLAILYCRWTSSVAYCPPPPPLLFGSLALHVKRVDLLPPAPASLWVHEQVSYLLCHHHTGGLSNLNPRPARRGGMALGRHMVTSIDKEEHWLRQLEAPAIQMRRCAGHLAWLAAWWLVVGGWWVAGGTHDGGGRMGGKQRCHLPARPPLSAQLSRLSTMVPQSGGKVGVVSSPSRGGCG